MRIDPKTLVPVSPSEPRDAKSQVAGKPAPAAAEASVVELSAAGTAAANAKPIKPDVEARITQIKSLLQAGAYPIDLDKLASSIVDDEVARGTK